MEYQQTKQQKPQPQGHIRSSGNERSSYKRNSFEAVMARALIDNGDACPPSALNSRQLGGNSVNFAPADNFFNLSMPLSNAIGVKS